MFERNVEKIVRHRLILITGGARSGKSTFAQRVAASCQQQALFVATGEPRDDEMAARIARHQSERPSDWHTLEVPMTIAQALDSVAHHPVVILDCVTLWVSNLLLANGRTWSKAIAELDALLSWYHAHPCTFIVVTNEVGLGIVPVDAMSRTYREWLGWFNQRLATEADEVYLMISGLAIEIKALAKS